MSAHGRPPGGTAGGAPAGGDDEYGAVVFDESFVRAARIREYSAEERMDDGARAVAPRHAWDSLARHRNALTLLLLMAVAFGAAVFLGVRHSYQPQATPSSGPLRVRLVALTPTGPVPAADGDPLFDHSGAVGWATGAAGITLPRARAAGRYTARQVLRALDITQHYLVASALDADELTTGDVKTLQDLIAPGQLKQFSRSLSTPADDGSHAATGWAVRFDTPRVTLADDRIRVRGAVSYAAAGGGLSVLTDHTMIYTVRPVGDITRPPSLFTVRRQLRLYFTPADLVAGRVEILRADVLAGPLACGSRMAAVFRPLLAGQTLPPGGTDPYSRATPGTSDCRAMAAQPMPDPTVTQPAPHGVATATAATPVPHPGATGR